MGVEGLSNFLIIIFVSLLIQWQHIKKDWKRGNIVFFKYIFPYLLRGNTLKKLKKEVTSFISDADDVLKQANFELSSQ